MKNGRKSLSIQHSTDHKSNKIWDFIDKKQENFPHAAQSVEVDGLSEPTKQYLGFFKLMWEGHKNLKKNLPLRFTG